mgnify:FL=1
MKTSVVKQYTIIGLGHIGASLGIALKKAYKSKVNLVGIDNNSSTIKKARKEEVYKEVETFGESKLMVSSEVIFVCVGIEDMPKVFSKLSKINFKKRVVITDVGSSKLEIFKKAKKIFSKNFDFVGGHPIAGTEKKGFSNSVDSLFEKKPFFISGVIGSKQSAKLIAKIWRKIGSEVFLVDPRQHDKIFAHLSHLPHVLAFGLRKIVKKNLSQKEITKYGGTSFKDYSRISESSSELWSEIFLSNSQNLLKTIKELRAYLQSLEKALKKNSKNTLIKTIESL